MFCKSLALRNKQQYETIICGAGIVGISAAYHLAKQGAKNVLLIDKHSPLSLTSDKSSECYRNFFPGPGNAMVSFMNRSVDLLDELANETENYFHMGRKGYLFVTNTEEKANEYFALAQEWCKHRNNDNLLRVHSKANNTYYQCDAKSDTQYKDAQLDGVDIIQDKALIRELFPYLSQNVHTIMHARRCGWISAQQLGMLLLERAKQMGVHFAKAEVTRVNIQQGTRVHSVTVQDESGKERDIATNAFVNCAGPYLKHIGHLMNIDLPVFNELHAKVTMPDTRQIVPRSAPMIIWSDRLALDWTNEEQEFIKSSPELAPYLLGDLPTGLHFRPVGGMHSNLLMLLWEFVHMDMPWQDKPNLPKYPLDFRSFYAEMCVKGLVRMVPDLAHYLQQLPSNYVDGGYYCKTKENRPLIGPVPSLKNAYVCGAVSGYGIMASQAAGELLATHVMGNKLPHYANAFLLSRYNDPEFIRLFKDVGKDVGQIS